MALTKKRLHLYSRSKFIGERSQSLFKALDLAGDHLRHLAPHKEIRCRQMEAEMKFRPLQDRILVKRVDSEVKTAGGIIIPNSAQEKPQEGLVVAMGNGKRLDDGTQIPMDVKKGDRILFGKYSGSEVKIDGEDHLILREDEILGVMEK